MVNVGSYLAIAQHFDSRKDILFSVAALGSSISGLSLLLFHDFLISQYGLYGCFLISGAVFLHALPAGVVMAQRNTIRHTRGDNPSQTTMKQNCLQLLANPMFVTWLILGMIGSLTTTCYYIIYVDYVMEIEVTGTSVVLMMTAGSVAGIPGRLLFGYLSNKMPHRKFLLSIFGFAVSGAIIFSMAFLKNELEFFIASVFFGVCSASTIMSFSIITEHLSKPEHRSEAFGFASTAIGIGLLITGPLSGKNIRSSVSTERWYNTSTLNRRPHAISTNSFL